MLNIQRYDYAKITPALIQSCIDDVDTLFDNKFVKANQNNQTLDELFNEKMPVWNLNWKILRETFLLSINNYVNIEFPQCKSWVYASFANTRQTQGHYWHSHPYSKFSGIMYLTLPLDEDNEPCFTTEFLEESGRTTFLEPVIGSWFIFDSRRVHRTGCWKYQEMKSNRYCLVASVY